MDKVILYFSLVVSALFVIYGLKKQYLKDWLLCFLFTAYFANITGTLVVKFKLISYLNLGSYLNSGQPFELFIFPTIVTYFYKTSYRLNVVNVIFQCALYTVGLTIVEVILEKYTSLIEYVNWHWIYSLLSFFCFMLAVRFILKFINLKTDN